MPETNKRAAAYVRVSTDGQAEGISLDTQEERILERAKKEGRTVWKEDVYVDVESATVYERAALQKLLGACRSGRYDTVYVLSTTVAHDRPEGRAVLKIAMSSYGVLALLLSEQS